MRKVRRDDDHSRDLREYQSPPRKSRYNDEYRGGDLSPPRRVRRSDERRQEDSPSLREVRHNAERRRDDLSPPREVWRNDEPRQVDPAPVKILWRTNNKHRQNDSFPSSSGKNSSKHKRRDNVDSSPPRRTKTTDRVDQQVEKRSQDACPTRRSRHTDKRTEDDLSSRKFRCKEEPRDDVSPLRLAQRDDLSPPKETRNYRKLELDERDKYLMEQERVDDPMYEYFQKKKEKKDAKEGKGMLINLLRPN